MVTQSGKWPADSSHCCVCQTIMLIVYNAFFQQTRFISRTVSCLKPHGQRPLLFATLACRWRLSSRHRQQRLRRSRGKPVGSHRCRRCPRNPRCPCCPCLHSSSSRHSCSSCSRHRCCSCRSNSSRHRCRSCKSSSQLAGGGGVLPCPTSGHGLGWALRHHPLQPSQNAPDHIVCVRPGLLQAVALHATAHSSISCPTTSCGHQPWHPTLSMLKHGAPPW